MPTKMGHISFMSHEAFVAFLAPENIKKTQFYMTFDSTNNVKIMSCERMLRDLFTQKCAQKRLLILDTPKSMQIQKITN
jgi:hypothetical protein